MAITGRLSVLFQEMSTKRPPVPPTGPDPRPSDPEQIRKDAAAWLSRLELGTADEAAFARWRDEHPTHALEFARAYANWEALRNVVSPDDLRVPARSFTRRHLLKVAGSAAALAAAGAFWSARDRGWTRIKTEVGEFRKLSLPDTSVIELNTDTELSWRSDRNRSVIRLARGEISMTLRPGFDALLLSADLVAHLLSGHYNARYVADVVRLTVMQGSARIEGPLQSPGTTAPVVDPSHTASLAAGGTVKIEIERNLDGITAWQNGEIVFHDEPLVTAIAAYNRYLTKKITILAPEAQSERVSGRFTTTQPGAFLSAVSIALDLRTTETDGQYLILPKK
jgi:transmembrane sensor